MKKQLAYILVFSLLASCKSGDSLPGLNSKELVTKKIELPNNSGFELISYYQDTIRHGIYEMHQADGKLERSGYYYNDSMAGKWVFYDSIGTIIEIRNFSRNEPNGVDSVFYPTGILRRTGVLIYGQEQGPWEYYNEDGTLKSRIIFADGKPLEGTYESYETEPQTK